MAVNINVPSQVKTYANLAAFPASGALKTIYIAEDTNKTYRWTGSVYVEVSAAGATGITIGTTAITSGTVGRVLFEGTGNVVQESANLTWDNTNGRLGIGTAAPAFRLEVQGGDVRFANGLTIGTAGSSGWQFSSNTLKLIQNGYLGVDVAAGREFNFTNTSFSTTYLKLASFTGNVLINTTTDAGFRLDVNGTARVSGNTTITSADVANPDVGPPAFNIFNGTFSKFNVVYNAAGCRINMFGTSTQGLRIDTGSNNAITAIGGGGLSVNSPSNNLTISGNAFLLNTAGSERIRILGTGNVLINTTTDAGYKLDVNGTARVSVASSTLLNQFTVISSLSRLDISPYDSSTYGVILRPSLNNGGAFVPLSLWGSKIQLETSATVHISSNATGGNASAILDVTSTTKGFLPPRMTTTQKNAIASPATGLQVHDTTLNRPCFYDGTTWITL